MKKNNEFKLTTNRQLYNKLYRRHLEHTAKIGCSYCAPNKGCNQRGKNKSYGGFTEKVTTPNWKLVSKNPKQWMKKPIIVKKEIVKWRNKEYVTITW